jgi:hypothetical protein
VVHGKRQLQAAFFISVLIVCSSLTFGREQSIPGVARLPACITQQQPQSAAIDAKTRDSISSCMMWLNSIKAFH